MQIRIYLTRIKVFSKSHPKRWKNFQVGKMQNGLEIFGGFCECGTGTSLQQEKQPSRKKV